MSNVRGTEHISEELARFIGKTLGIVAIGDGDLAIKLIDEVSKIVDQNSLDVIDGFKELLNDDEEGEKAAKEFIKAQLPNIFGEDDEDE